jgi:hypothetical protein
MSWRPCVVLCWLWFGCASEDRVDPSALELRDVLGLSPEVAMGWDADQRAAARHVLEAAMHDVDAVPIEAPLEREPTLDRSLANALAGADGGRATQRQAALGVVELAVTHDHLHATSRASTLVPHATSATPIELAGWDRPGWTDLPSRGLDVLATIASDAGHRGGRLLVTPAPQLAVIAGYVAATPVSRARLLVNPVLLAALEPSPPAGPHDAPPIATVLPDDPIGNPYTFYRSVVTCAAAQQQRCEACLPKGSCTSLAGNGDGNAECSQLAADAGSGYSLACINFALAIDSVASCTATGAPTCPMNTTAASSIAELTANRNFLDQPMCASALDQCLDEIFGNASHSSGTPPTPSPGSSPGCADSTCEATPDCSDTSCDDSGDDSSCSSDGGGDCSGDNGGGCNGDSGCSGDSGGDCSGGGGNDCNAGRHHGPSNPSLLWACLPLPFAIVARRVTGRRRRRAKREVSP